MWHAVRFGRDRSRMVASVGLAMLVAAATACLDISPSPVSCESNGECFKGQTCVDGKCQTVDEAPDTRGDTEDTTADTAIPDATATDGGSGDTSDTDGGAEDTTVADTPETEAGDANTGSDTDTAGSPIAQSDPTFWLRADDITEEYGVEGTNVWKIKTWPDRSSTGDYDFISGLHSQGAPKLSISGKINRHRYVQFEPGRNTVLELKNRANNFVETETATIFFVVRNTGGYHKGELLASCGCSSSGKDGSMSSCNTEFRFDDGEASRNRFYARASGGTPDSAMFFPGETTNWHVLTVVLETEETSDSGSSGNVRITLDKRDASGTTTHIEHANFGQLTGSWQFNQIGARCNENYLHADIAEVVFFSQVL
ncbi:MAG: hypothetical protein ABEN55_22660, partial [Bradymonadaceae bacterium]